jgi:hypothetical protein
VQGPGGGPQTIEEFPDSPEIERAEQATIRHRFSLSWTDATTLIHGLGRGTFQTDSNGNLTRVLSARIAKRHGNTAEIEVVSEGVSFDSPPDEFDCQPVELGINIMKHPRYWYALKGANATDELQNQAVIRALQNYMDIPTFPSRNSIVLLIKNSLGHPDGLDADSNPTLLKGTDLAKAAALEIIQKIWRNEETPYVVGLMATWSVYYWLPPDLNLGGYVEDPITQANPQIPDYFWVDKDGFEITSQIAALNPQCYSSDGTAGGDVNISWLRKADQLHYNRTWFKLDRIWIGSPVGFWDPQLYTQGARPTVATDYLPMDTTPLPG